MNRKNILPIITFVSVLLCNVTTILKGVKHHEDYLITIGAIGCGFILIAFTLTMAKLSKDKKRRQSI